MFRAVRLIIAAVVLVAGCAPGGTVGGAMNPAADKPTITKAQALTRIEQLIDGTASAIRPKPQLDLYQPSLNDGLCLDPQDGGSEDRIVVSREYHLRGLPTTEDALKEVIAEVKAYWQSQGHDISGENENGLQLYAHSRPDDFLMSIGWAAGNVLTLGANSTCLWPNGTPEPSSTP
ncbi:hypothetical protein DMB42_19985 [Nonomuraea sp. WAC 01424]|uniref:hypothetical protein n=1 Tax=Nonomuraea sp. WAC 01424 TaxID=2203200 RepID=UPI000F7A2C90|nr:hypothetical protein [Nonomuraea sp. WAC 01424]RSN08335.1 hypothetical protein DMB42_19985 [Nonomuraea sp. WAC 01424]